jgi:hypothetical protein
LPLVAVTFTRPITNGNLLVLCLHCLKTAKLFGIAGKLLIKFF